MFTVKSQIKIELFFLIVMLIPKIQKNIRKSITGKVARFSLQYYEHAQLKLM